MGRIDDDCHDKNMLKVKKNTRLCVHETRPRAGIVECSSMMETSFRNAIVDYYPRTTAALQGGVSPSFGLMS